MTIALIKSRLTLVDLLPEIAAPEPVGVALGTPTVTRALQGYAQEAGLPKSLSADLSALASVLPASLAAASLAAASLAAATLPGPPPPPAELSARLTTLAEIMAAGPNLDLARARLERSLHVSL